MNMGKIEDTTKRLKDENNSIERQYRSVIYYICSIPATHKLVTGLGCCYPNYHESTICNMCSDTIQKLSNYELDDLWIAGVCKLI